VRTTFIFRDGKMIEKPNGAESPRVFVIGTPIGGFYEHLSNDGVEITSRKHLKDECRAREKYAPHVFD